MGLKRDRDQHGEVVDSLEMAKCLILLSHQSLENSYCRNTSKSDIFECKTCNKKFSSFQALGGHRASHKKPKLSTGEKLAENESSGVFEKSLETTKKIKKMHECFICGVEFPRGQALGGHMRKHRVAMAGGFEDVSRQNAVVSKPPLFQRSSSSKRVFGLDLNLTPLENDLAFLFGKSVAPKLEDFL